MPVEQGPFQRIVNVSWGGIVFVVKSIDAELILGEMEQPRGKWKSLGHPFDAFGGLFANSGSSSAITEIVKDGETIFQPVVVVSAIRSNENNDNGSIIMASKNGTDWELVFERYEVNEGTFRSPFICEPTGIVWDEDEKAFFAAFYESDIRFITEAGTTLFYDGETIYSSKNGFSWKQVSRSVKFRGVAGSAEGLTDDDTSDLRQYCKKPENEGGIPDGLQAYDKSSKTFMRPQSLTGFSPVDGAQYGETGIATSPVIIVEREDEEPGGSGSASAPVYAVGQYGGTWVAVGGVRSDTGPGSLTIDVSIDRGKTWKNVFTQPGNFTTAATVSGIST